MNEQPKGRDKWAEGNSENHKKDEIEEGDVKREVKVIKHRKDT